MCFNRFQWKFSGLCVRSFNTDSQYRTHYERHVFLMETILCQGDESKFIFSIRTNATTVKHNITPWRRALPDKLTGYQLVKKFPAFYGTRRFITTFTTARQLSVSWARSVQSMLTDPYFLKIHFNIILPSMLRSAKWSLPNSFPLPLKPCIHLFTLQIYFLKITFSYLMIMKI